MSSSKDKLLKVAFEEIYQNGYHATSVDKILKKASMNKGSMYHFFKSKKELILAIIDVHVDDYIQNKYGVILESEENMIEAIMAVLKNKPLYNFIYGCRLNNLVHELSNQDNDFKIALEKSYFKFEEIFQIALDRAVEIGEIKKDTDTKAVGMFILATIQGGLTTSKKSSDSHYYDVCIEQLNNYLNLLKTK
ncbi:TetR/AcrR family transcriptional regulator [Poseidonibacter lekithochrous]|uniref:TetR/AcrR family transcriptional regulator n=1 Tax=Poseidonibacter lekithochrous TaxID=1904463 RepID=UPI0008FCC14A|nr:TetR/AcrR family transcriptional regulator [Poseidonibacter lekithochrous]QKJ24231.1 transcriptional regulator, TetR/AcrR family [Poseidonibacter lekithochrous]